MIDGEIMQVDPDSLVTEVLQLKHRDYRLIQICAANAGEGIDITYSFGKGYKMAGLRLSILPDDEIVSISDIYAPAWLYENEMHDLFGVKVKMMSTDYHGTLYRLKNKTPYRKETAASQPEKADLPISWTPTAMETSVSDGQTLKAKSPIFDTDAGMLTLSSDIHCANA